MTTQILIQRIPELVTFFVLLGWSAFFSAAETSLFSLTREDLRVIGLSSSASSRAIQALLRDPQALLAAVLLGNMLVNLSLYSLSILIALQLSTVSAFCGGRLRRRLAPAVILFGEASPKGIAVSGRCRSRIGSRRRCTSSTARSIRSAASCGACPESAPRSWRGASARAVRHARRVAHADRDGREQGAAHRAGARMIEQVVDLANLRAKELMTPRVDMPLFNLAVGHEGFCDLVKIDREERMLAYEGTADNIVGMLFTRDALLHPEADIRALLRPVRFVPETQPVETLLRYFIHAKDSVAVVVDEYGGTAGLVTLEHILEECRRRDPRKTRRRRREPPVQQLDEDTYLLAGHLNTRDWRPLVGAGFNPAGMETLGGFVMSLLGRVPKEGERVERRGLRFVVEKMSGRRVGRVRVERIRPSEQPIRPPRSRQPPHAEPSAGSTPSRGRPGVGSARVERRADRRPAEGAP